MVTLIKYQFKERSVAGLVIAVYDHLRLWNTPSQVERIRERHIKTLLKIEENQIPEEKGKPALSQKERALHQNNREFNAFIGNSLKNPETIGKRSRGKTSMPRNTQTSQYSDTSGR